MRTLSLDIGRNKTGVAISDETIGIVTPLDPIVYPIKESPDIWYKHLTSLLYRKEYELYQIDTVVIGSWKDKEYINKEMEVLVKVAIKTIEKWTDWKVVLVQETRTSIESKNLLKSMGMKYKKIARSVDSYAATLLLIDYLELIKPRTINDAN